MIYADFVCIVKKKEKKKESKLERDLRGREAKIESEIRNNLGGKFGVKKEEAGAAREMEKGGEAKIDLKRDGIEDLSGRVHLLPCCIKHDGPTEVSQYFKPKPTGVVGEDGLPLQQSHFRGRLLEGTTLPLPHNYSGNQTCFLFFLSLSFSL